MMTKWNEQAAPDNNLKASDLIQDEAGRSKMSSKAKDGDHLNDLKIQQEIRKQNL
jgi:hypothetical protein